MAVLIALSTPGKERILPKIARLLPFRGRKRVAPFLDQHKQLSVSSSGIQAQGTEIKYTRIFAAQLGALRISELRISEDEAADALLDIIANSKTLPEGDDVIIADLEKAEGFFTYLSHPLSDSGRLHQLFNSLNKELRRDIIQKLTPEELMHFLIDPKVERKEEFIDFISNREQFNAIVESNSSRLHQLFNSLKKELRRDIVQKLTPKEQIQYLVDPKIERKEDFIDLIDDQEKLNVLVEIIRKIRKTSNSDGLSYIRVLKLLGKDTHVTIAPLIKAFEERHQNANEAAIQPK